MNIIFMDTHFWYVPAMIIIGTLDPYAYVYMIMIGLLDPYVYDLVFGPPVFMFACVDLCMYDMLQLGWLDHLLPMNLPLSWASPPAFFLNILFIRNCTLSWFGPLSELTLSLVWYIELTWSSCYLCTYVLGYVYGALSNYILQSLRIGFFSPTIHPWVKQVLNSFF